MKEFDYEYEHLDLGSTGRNKQFLNRYRYSARINHICPLVLLEKLGVSLHLPFANYLPTVPFPNGFSQIANAVPTNCATWVEF